MPKSPAPANTPPEEFAAAWPDLKLRDCLYAAGEPSAGPGVILLPPSLLAKGILGCFISVIVAELAALEAKEQELSPEQGHRRAFAAMEHTLPWPDLELPTLRMIINLAQDYPELADRNGWQAPEQIEAAGLDAPSRGLTVAALTRPAAAE